MYVVGLKSLIFFGGGTTDRKGDITGIDAPTATMMDRLDAMDDSREDVESSLEDLLIFPNRDGLRRVVDGMASHFALEGEIMRIITCIGSSLPERDCSCSWVVEEQDRILGIANGELNEQRTTPSTTSTCVTGN